ncbi:ABC transporter permease [Fodinibius sediminis]|uniref:Lipoprotein-releasing system permease protein n=1 Tax=Fodinibius sediminis TaxID=1214077 RepID=A0A521B0J8_9BACT|nr:ABC transporter permease [Fodinibius sediminis]SMO40531.1 lipoprotein-releasing system permease protein [Fodinibius sediminis]
MNFEWYLARRYFKGKRQGSRFLSFIKIMAITGVAVGSAGLLIALSVVHGFKSAIDDKVLGFAPHITISRFSDTPILRADTLLSDLEAYPEIQQAQAVIEGQAMLQSPEEVTGILFKGVDQKGDVTDIRQYIDRGRYFLGKDSTGMPGIVIGSKLAQSLSADINSVLTAYTIEGLPSPLSSPEIKQFRLSGIYQTGIGQFDNIFALVARPHAQQLFQVPPDQASVIEIRLHDQSGIGPFKQHLSEDIGFPYFTESIYEKYSSIFAWVDLQEETIPFVISVMIIVAAFNLIGTVLMMVLERTRDIGILKTMGASDKSIRYIFMLEGLFVAVTGLLIGIGISLLFTWLQSTYHLIPLSEQNYYMAYAPTEPHGLDFLIVTAVTLLLCTLSSYLPARIAAQTDPLKVIAYGR